MRILVPANMSCFATDCARPATIIMKYPILPYPAMRRCTIPHIGIISPIWDSAPVHIPSAFRLKVNIVAAGKSLI